jgi:hypothetical protein
MKIKIKIILLKKWHQNFINTFKQNEGYPDWLISQAIHVKF